MRTLKSFLRDECGASAAEYALILVAICAGLVTLIANLSSAISNAINSTQSGFNGVNNS